MYPFGKLLYRLLNFLFSSGLLFLSLSLWKRVASVEESVEEAIPDIPEENSPMPLNFNQAHIVIYFKDNPILWKRPLEDSGLNEPKVKTVMAPLTARFEKKEKGHQGVKKRYKIRGTAYKVSFIFPKYKHYLSFT